MRLCYSRISSKIREAPLSEASLLRTNLGFDPRLEIIAIVAKSTAEVDLD